MHDYGARMQQLTFRQKMISKTNLSLLDVWVEDRYRFPKYSELFGTHVLHIQAHSRTGSAFSCTRRLPFPFRVGAVEGEESDALREALRNGEVVG